MPNAEPECADSLRGHLVGNDDVERPGGVAAHFFVVGLEQRHQPVETALNAELRASENSQSGSRVCAVKYCTGTSRKS